MSGRSDLHTAGASLVYFPYFVWIGSRSVDVTADWMLGFGWPRGRPVGLVAVGRPREDARRPSVVVSLHAAKANPQNLRSATLGDFGLNYCS